MEFLESWVLALSGSPWVYAVVFLFCIVDGFFPPIPSETVVVALAATWASAGVPDVWLVWLVAGLGAFTGDQIAYTIGLNVNVRRWRAFQNRQGQAALDWAERMLYTRGVSFIVAARFIPVGRVAVNMTAGAVRYRRLRFVAVDLVAAVIWGGYGVAIGVFAGHWFQDNPLLAVAAGVVAGIVVGLLVDPLVRRLTGTPSPPAQGPQQRSESADERGP